MSISHTNPHQPQKSTPVTDDTESNSPNASPNTTPTQGKKRSASSLSRDSVDSVINSREAKAPDAQSETQSGSTRVPSMSTPKRLMAAGKLVNPPKQPMPVDLSQILSAIDLPSPPATGIISPAQHYPSSQPVLKSYPASHNQPIDQITLAPLAPLAPLTSLTPLTPLTPLAPMCAMTQTPFQLLPLMANSYGPFALRLPSFQSPKDLHQPPASIAAPESLIDVDDERPAKRRRMNEGVDTSPKGNSSPTTELPVWHQSKLKVER